MSRGAFSFLILQFPGTLLFFGTLLLSCTERNTPAGPNIILIMADDMGYECLGSNGGLSYETPVLDALAGEGIRFTNCYSQPLCTPSRVKIMTGLYNYRNYEYFGYLNEEELTFAHVLKGAGYATLISGKWQLNGLAYKLPGYDDSLRPYAFGFDEYCLWQLTIPGNKGSRYADPVFEQNGERLEPGIDAYGPDLFVNYITDFISRKKDEKFFVYYPMVLVHSPFVPTPDSKEWNDPASRLKSDTAYFSDMVRYTDKTVGRIIDCLKDNGIYDNTILIFTGDNGTDRAIASHTSWGRVKGFKGNTTDAGTRVPLIINWPEKMKHPQVYEGLVDFSDFFPTFAEIADTSVYSDGRSILPLLEGRSLEDKQQIFIHYDPKWGRNVNRFRNQFARTHEYKLYQDGGFYYLPDDVLEEKGLEDADLSPASLEIKQQLQELLHTAPAWNDHSSPESDIK